MAEPKVTGVELKKGYKFALLAAAECTAGALPTPLVDFGNGFAISSGLPSQALETWEDNIGKIHQRELAKTKVFLWSMRQSSAPETLDPEGEELARDVYRLYLGFLIAIPYVSNGRLTAFKGGNEHGVARVRSVAWYPRTYRTLGTPRVGLSLKRVQHAGTVAAALRKHSANPKHPITRSIRAFRQACEAGELDVRLHQFVRALEGFVIPPFGASATTFAANLRRVSSGRRNRALKELYWIRSGIEHLDGPFTRMPKRPRGGRHLRLLLRCMQAEAFDRWMLYTYLSTPELWQHFKSRAAIDAFWKLDGRALREAWPERIPFGEVIVPFDRDEALRAIRKRR